MVCEAWALQGYGAPFAVYLIYALKLAIYIGVWVFFCSRSPGLGGPATLSSWGLSPLAFQKAVIWSMLFEGLGLGCGSGPLTGRYLPPVGGFIYFLRPGTTKLPVFPGLPLLGGNRRSWFDVALYAALIALLLRPLLAADRDSGAADRPGRSHDLPGAARRTLLDDHGLLRPDVALDRRRQGSAARALVLGGLLEAQPSLPSRRLRDDQ
jgi:hypothetical protein